MVPVHKNASETPTVQLQKIMVPCGAASASWCCRSTRWPGAEVVHVPFTNMYSTLAKTALRAAVRRPATPIAAARRNMSGDAAHAAEEMAKWKKMTGGMGVLCVIVTAFVVATEEHHHKDEDAPVLSHMEIRSKPFPWTCAKCSILDSACFAKCKEERGL